MNHRLLWIICCLLISVILYFWYFKKNLETFDENKIILLENIKPKLPTGIWTVHPTGRLGNLMGQYAALYALAKLNGHRAYILPEMHEALASIFQVTLPVIQSNDANIINWKQYQLHDWMSEEYKNIEGEFVKLTGYPCSWTFYHNIRKEILHEFRFHTSVQDEAYTFLRQISGAQKNITYVGVHVRRGDYVHVMPNIWKGVIADKNYLQKAMDYFRRKYSNPLFVVTSNGMDWCKENINGSLGDIFFAGNGNENSPGHDFAILAHCNHTIMTIGTFGYWVGYLVGGETIYLTNFTLPDSPFLEIFKYEAAFLPEWIGIAADLSPLLHQEFRTNA